MKNKKGYIIKVASLLMITLSFLWNCSIEENNFQEEEINSKHIETVSFKEAMNHFNTKKRAKNPENNFEITPDWNSLQYNEVAYTEAFLTTADSKINRDGKYSSQLYYINVDGYIKNVILTTWKDKVDNQGNVINGRIFFNNLQGRFLDGYVIKEGVFTKRYVVKKQVQQAGFLPLMFFQTTDLVNAEDCWNTDTLGEFDGGELGEVVVTGSSGGGGGSNTGYTGDYANYINEAAAWDSPSTGGGGGSSLSSSQVTSAASAILMAMPIRPDDNGNCPLGFVFNSTSGMCESICNGGKTYNTSTSECECSDYAIEDKSGNCYANEELYFEANPEEWIIYEAPNDVIELEKYLKCFDNVPNTADFKFTVYIDQPIANQSDTWTNDGTIINPDINVGHTFMSLEANNGGNITSQVIGFYPSAGVYPSSPQVAGAWIDDGNHYYDVSVSINLDHSTFINLINSIRNFGTPTYNLNSLNCTDAAIQLGNSLGMSLPDTNGSWIGGGGSNPGNLGQDIRGLNSSNLNVNTSSGIAGLSKGACN